MLKKLRAHAAPFSLSRSSSGDAASKLTWTRIGNADTHLFTELEKLYWNGIEQEFEYALATLRTWQLPRLNQISIEDEPDDFVHGFDTFIDQVTDRSREFASRVEESKDRVKSNGNTKENHLSALEQHSNYTEALSRYTEETLLDMESANLKFAIREDIQAQKPESALRQRTRMLLQATGVLDIEKLIEYRHPLTRLSFWKRPAVPQLRLKEFTPSGVPIFVPHQCSACNNIINGSMYKKTSQDEKMTLAYFICEECYHSKFVGSPEYSKIYKHCVLDETITPSVSQRLCSCDSVPRNYDTNGAIRALFPTEKADKHHKATWKGMVECSLLGVGNLVAEAKFDGLRMAHSKKRKEKSVRNEKTNLKIGVTEKANKGQGRRPKAIAEENRYAPDRKMTKGDTIAIEEDEATSDIPSFLKQYTENHPFGNVHMALRIGPVVIENGVEHSQGGALITLRNSSLLSSRQTTSSGQSLALSEDPVRQLWAQTRPCGKQKRFKAIMKQVVGSPFTGFLDETIEDRVIDGLIVASQQPFDDAGLSRQDRARRVKQLLGPVIEDVRKLIGAQLSVYLESITSRLLSSDVSLKWSPTDNDCQNFCDALIDPSLFGPLVNPDLYLMSFVCRPAGYIKPKIKSKFDVPRGLTEEYLLRFRFGRHDEADIIDSLQEYWYDWGAFGNTLYRYQNLFPWDCTEAFGRYPGRCGECNLSKHVWAFPFDSWSIIALHLARDRYEYQATSDEASLSDKDWMRNRLLVLSAQEKLIRAATAMACNETFRKRTAWLHTQPDVATDRLKLGGIHRAQPFSHFYDHCGRYRHYFIASWAILNLKERVAEYEKLRDGRARLPDVEYSQLLYDNSGDIDKTLKQATDATGGPMNSFGLSINDSMLHDGYNTAEGGIGNESNCRAGCGSSDCGAGDRGGGGGRGRGRGGS